MAKQGVLERSVAARLRAVMASQHIEGNKPFARICGVGDSTPNNWLLADNLPDMAGMIRLCQETGITLDWIFRGYAGGMPAGYANKLNSLASKIARDRTWNEPIRNL
ncbi:MAG TPA: hypothetical protein VGG99_18625 [Acetobacteraceae bacterium]|jgi:transcriptional regulator with XRE-family HTH domain